MFKIGMFAFTCVSIGLIPLCLGFLDQNDVQTRLNILENRTHYLEQDIKVKNDLTQFLQASVTTLNNSLTAERAKSATLEAKVADLEKRLQNQIASSGELAGDVKSASTLAKSLKSELDNAKQDIQSQSTALQIINQTFSQSINRVSQRIDLVNGNLTSLEQTLALATNSMKVYFTYRNSDRTVPSGSKQTLKFHGRIVNEGNAYNQSTGEFIAPTDGVYWFSLTLGVAATDFLNCYIVKNDQLFLVEVYTSAYSAYSSASSSVTIALNNGDKVAVSGCHGNGTISPYKTSFTGMLVHEY